MGDCIKLNSVVPHSLCSSPNIIWMTNQRDWRWAGHVARSGEKRNAYKFFVGEV